MNPIAKTATGDNKAPMTTTGTLGFSSSDEALRFDRREISLDLKTKKCHVHVI